VTTAHGKCPDGVTLLPWAKDKPLAWDVTVPDIMPTHLADTATTAGATAGRRTVTKKPVGLPAAGQQPHLCTSCHRDSLDLGQKVKLTTKDNKKPCCR